MKCSIIIPTAFDGLESRLLPCLESIRKFTDLTDTEIIVVKNGCTWISDLPDCKVLSFDDAIGYPAAVNFGIKQAEGEFVVLLNDDTVLLEQPKNMWIDILLRAFWDEKMAIAGPWMNWCPHAEHDFLIFFCVMIRKSVFERIGLLDEEAFGAGYGEDADFCCKAKAAGFKIAQVPIAGKLDYDGRMAHGQFPIYHSGNETFRNWPGGEELLRKNRTILHQRYGTNIGRAHECDGFMSPEELRWLAETSRKSKVVIEIGSWHGRSSRAIADNLPDGGRLYCIDTWAGSKTEQDTNHASARDKDGDAAFLEFSENLWEHIESGRVIPLRLHGCHAAHLLHSKGVTADFLFLDAGHSKGETLTDISVFLPLLKKGGVISGHDYRNGMWPDVTDEVHAVFGAFVGNPRDTTIWYTDSTGGDAKCGVMDGRTAEERSDLTLSSNGASKVQTSDAPKVYDCFTFFNELELLELRLNELDSVVDRFVIVEATKTHQGNPKPLYFQENIHRFGKWLYKITHIIDEFPDEMETGGGPSFPSGMNWSRERHQREAIMQGLAHCKDNDIIIIGDGDEIGRAETIKTYKPEMGLMRMEMELFCYYMNCTSPGGWRESKILPYELLKRMGPCNVRYSLHTIGTHGAPLPNAGWHFSFMGGSDRVKQKIRSYSHGEYAVPEVLDYVEERLAKGVDVFGRDGFTYEMVEINGRFPRYVTENLERYRELGFVK